ncbi:MAG TPA: hypothetical protein VKQ08_07610, partial [Cyclobacteriaceae bacterium]|nr:hypothetical protein [Cyclobacteriaceae bacterium]
MEKNGWTKRVLSVVLNEDETGINKIIAGKRTLDADIALALQEIFNVKAEHFIELQKSYELAQARITAITDPNIKNRAQLFGTLPVAEMINRGWLDADDVRDFPKVETALSKFFGVSSTQEIEVFSHAAKKTNVSGPATPIQLAWLYRVKEIASEMLTARFSQEGVIEAVSKLKPLLKHKDGMKKVPRILQDYGIRFLIVEALSGAKIDGAAFWLNEKKPVIGITLRFDRIDNFWFVLRHEIEHVLRGHGRSENAVMLDSDLEEETPKNGSGMDEEEKVANAAAADFCVPQKA